MVYGIIFHLLKRPVNFWTNFANFDHCGTASNYVPCMWPLQTSVSSKILRSSDTLSKSLKEGGGFAKIKSKSDNPPTYLALILSKPHVIYYTKQPFYKPVLHYISVTLHILWHYISVTHIFDLFFYYNIGGTSCTRISEFQVFDREFWMAIIGVCYWFMINLYNVVLVCDTLSF